MKSASHDFERMASVCRTKRFFKNKSVAKDWAKRVQAQHGGEMLAYRCKVCGGWHLGTRSKTEAFRARKAGALVKLRREAVPSNPAPSESDAASLIESEGHAEPSSRRQE